MEAGSSPAEIRGRPPVFSEEALRQAAAFSYARRVGTRRGAQDLVYRMFAIAAIEHYCEAFPESAPALDWLLKPRRRDTLLSELGRFGNPSSGKDGQLQWNGEDVSLLIRAALELAELRPSTKEGVAMLRVADVVQEASSESIERAPLTSTLARIVRGRSRRSSRPRGTRTRDSTRRAVVGWEEPPRNGSARRSAAILPDRIPRGELQRAADRHRSLTPRGEGVCCRVGLAS